MNKEKSHRPFENAGKRLEEYSIKHLSRNIHLKKSIIIYIINKDIFNIYSKVNVLNLQSES